MGRDTEIRRCCRAHSGDGSLSSLCLLGRPLRPEMVDETRRLENFPLPPDKGTSLPGSEKLRSPGQMTVQLASCAIISDLATQPTYP